MKWTGSLVLVVAGCLVCAGGQQTKNGELQPRQRPLDEIASLRARVKSLEERVARLERLLSKTPSVHAKPLGTVGQITIVGNTETTDTVILGQLPFKPGDTFSNADLDLAVRRLELLHLFVVDPVREIRPIVRAIEGEQAPEALAHILVEIREKP